MDQGFNNNTMQNDSPPFINPNPNNGSNPYAKTGDGLPIDQDIRRSFLGDDNYAVDANQLVARKNSWHIRSLISTIILIGGIVTFVLLYINLVIDVSIGGLIGICAGVYVFYLILALACNPLLAYLGHIEHGVNFQTAYQKTRSISGHFSFHVQCYHYETRYHTRTVTDSNGNRRTETYTTTEKVVTHRATQQLYPKECIDDSGNIAQVQASTEVIFVHNIVNYRFRDEFSRGQFEMAWLSFQNRHRRDAHQDYSQNFLLPGLVARICFYVGKQPTNYKCILILLSFLGLIWPYSMYVESKVSRFNIQYMKVVGF